MKTLSELEIHLAAYRSQQAQFPTYSELAELCGIASKPEHEFSSAEKLTFVHSKCQSGKIIDWEANYILNCWISSGNAFKMDMLNQRQIDFINLLYERHSKAKS
jgi:hypothetical protein